MIFSALRNPHRARPGPLAGLTLWAAFQFSEVATRRSSNTGPVSACESHHTHTHAQEMKRRAKRHGARSPQVTINQDLGHSEEKDIGLQSHSLSVSRAVPENGPEEGHFAASYEMVSDSNTMDPVPQPLTTPRLAPTLSQKNK